LPPQTREYAVGTFFLDNPLESFGSERLDIDSIGNMRVRHNRCGVRVDENNLGSLIAENSAGLRSGIVKFSRLTDYDWSGADDQNFSDVVITRHIYLNKQLTVNSE
jgi:hypothetical protein